MNEHLAFAQCLQRLLNETELTATEVARRLEMRSRNSIFRILKGKTSPQLNRRFLESFHKHMGEQLTEAQWAALDCALEMDTVGEVEYKSRQALMQLVGAFSEPISPAKVCYLDALGAEKEDSFLHYLQVLFCGALKVNALLFGCCDLGLFRQLQEAIHPVAQRVIVRIDHFIYAGGGRNCLEPRGHSADGGSAVLSCLSGGCGKLSAGAAGTLQDGTDDLPCDASGWLGKYRGAVSAGKERIYRNGHVDAGFVDEPEGALRP